MSNDPDAARRRKRETLDKLGWVCRQIEHLLAGQDVRLGDLLLPHEAKPGETPLERLQAFKALLSEALAEQNRGEPRRCRRCQQPIPAPQLDAMPWAWACAACA